MGLCECKENSSLSLFSDFGYWYCIRASRGLIPHCNTYLDDTHCQLCDAEFTLSPDWQACMGRKADSFCQAMWPDDRYCFLCMYGYILKSGRCQPVDETSNAQLFCEEIDDKSRCIRCAQGYDLRGHQCQRYRLLMEETGGTEILQLYPFCE